MFHREYLFRGFLSTLFFAVFLVVCLALSLTGYAQDYTACTDDALVCEDGTVVGRTGPDCAFAPCPEDEIPVTLCTREKVCDADGTCSFISSCDDSSGSSAEIIGRRGIQRPAVQEVEISDSFVQRVESDREGVKTVVKEGARHPWVLEAQKLLNRTTCPVAKFGVGSPGRETDYFGSETRRALKCYVSLGGDYSGTITESLVEGLRAYVKKYAKTPILFSGEDIVSGFDRAKKIVVGVKTVVEEGARHPLVLEAQKLLNKTTCPVAKFGVGSPGRETDYFGSKTLHALKCYASLGGDYSGTITESLVAGLRAYVKKYSREPVLVPSENLDPGFYRPVKTVVRQGTRHSWVLEAQKLLNRTTCPVAKFGVGSPGRETDYFGTKTHIALKCYASRGGDYSGTITESLVAGLRAYVKKYAELVSERYAEITSCTQEALTCPDGTVVGRIGSGCEFAPCPGGRMCLTFSNYCSTCRRSDSLSAWRCASFSGFGCTEEFFCKRWSDVGVPPKILAFSPSQGSTVTDRGQNITITFSEPIKRDARGADFTRTDISRFVGLSTDLANHPDRQIPYTPSINADKTVITLDPARDLPIGKVSVHVPGGWYDADGGNKVFDSKGATFTVSGTPEPPSDVVLPRVTAFSPSGKDSDSTYITDRGRNITITFSEPIKKNARGADFTRADIPKFLDFYTYTGNVAGINRDVDIPYTASINADKTVITLDPVGDLPFGWLYLRVGMKGPHYYYDADGNLGAGANLRFHVSDPNAKWISVPGA